MTMLFNFGKTASKAPAKSSTPAKSSAAPSKKAEKTDMTWGGRPDPCPELYVDESAEVKFGVGLFGRKKRQTK